MSSYSVAHTLLEHKDSQLHCYLIDGPQHLCPARHTRRTLAEQCYTLLQLLNDLLSLVVVIT